MAAIGKIVIWVWKGFCWLEESFLCILLFSMIFLACLQIILRDVFSTGLLWADPLLRYMVVWVGLFGAALATKRGKHIAIDFTSYLLPARMEPWLRGLIHLFSSSVSIGLTYAAILFVRNEAAFGGGRELIGMPSWVLNLVFPLAFGLISCRFMIFAIINVIEIVKTKRHQTVESV